MNYRLKLIVTLSLLIALSFGIGGTLLIATSFQASVDQQTQAALSSFETVRNMLVLLSTVGGRSNADSFANTLSGMGTQWLGNWQAISLKNEEKSLFQSGDSELLAYTLPGMGETLCSYRLVSDRFGHGLVLKGSLRTEDATLELSARFDLTQVYEMRDLQQKRYLALYVAVVLVGVAASAVLSFALTWRLHRLTVAVLKISGGDLSRRSAIDSRDEFGQLSRDFDAMADKLQENISRLETDMQRQENFMGAFSHELKTPMTSIIGFADLLRQGNLDENTRMMAADYIFSEGHRLERLSFKLLDLILLKKDEVVMKRVRLGNYLAEVERALTPNLKSRGVRLVCRADQKPAVLEPDLVKSLLYNLIDNAAKAMDNGGMVAVGATAIPGGCQFQVVDNGRGMEPEELTKITEAFYRVDKARSRSQGGAGLGLALCRQIVELHNGSIRFESQPGKGTRVTVVLYGKAGKHE